MVKLSQKLIRKKLRTMVDMKYICKYGRGIGSNEKLGGDTLSLEKLGRQNLLIYLESNVFEGKKDKIH